MVTDAILIWFLDMVQAMLDGIPKLELPDATVNFAFMTDVNYFLPVTEMFTLFAAFFALGGPLAGISLVVWFFIGILRGGSTKA